MIFALIICSENVLLLHEFVGVAEFLFQFFQPGLGRVLAGVVVPGFGQTGIHVKGFAVQNDQVFHSSRVGFHILAAGVPDQNRCYESGSGLSGWRFFQCPWANR